MQTAIGNNVRRMTVDYEELQRKRQLYRHWMAKHFRIREVFALRTNCGSGKPSHLIIVEHHCEEIEMGFKFKAFHEYEL